MQLFVGDADHSKEESDDESKEASPAPMAIANPAESMQKKKDIRGTLIATDGYECPSEIVFVAALKFIKTRALEIVADKYKMVERGIDEIQWVLTVPAIWTDKAKHLMKTWAVKAGLIFGGDKEKPDHLVSDSTCF